MHWTKVGGAESLAMQSIEWALALGFRVIVVTEHKSDGNALPDGAEFIDLSGLSRSEWPDRIVDIVRQEQVVGIHIHHCVPMYASLGAVRRQVPWVQVVDSLHIPEYFDGGFVRISGVWSNHIDRTHVISQSLADFYKEKFGRLPDLGRMVERVDLPEICNIAARDALRVAFVGRAVYQKRPMTVIWAMRRLLRWAKSVGVEISFSWVGQGPFLPFVTEYVTRSELVDHFHFYDETADVRSIMRNSDVLILPSANEGLALVAIEAVESGVIPICSNVGAMSELLPPELLVSPSPMRAVCEIEQTVLRLWNDRQFAADCYARLAAALQGFYSGPTAHSVISEYYREFGTKQ